MRTRPIAAATGLILVAALVAVVGPAESRAPGTPAVPSPGAFRPFSGMLPADTTTSYPTDDRLFRLAPTAGDTWLLDPDAPVFPAGRPVVPLPAVVPVAVSKSPWRSAGYSWYGPGFYGSGTACGQVYTETILGVAHRTLPCGTRVTFRNPANGRTITVRVIDRGPYVSGRLWDLSAGTCLYLDACYTGTIEYRIP